MINVENLDFSYGDNLVLSGVNFNVSAGDSVGLIGFNGSGKTTLIKLLLGILKQTSGSIQVIGQTPNINDNSFKSQIGIAFDESNLINYLTVREYLEFVIDVYNIYIKEIAPSKIDYFIEQFQIKSYEKILVKNLSHGTLKKVQLISSMISKPELIVLDEPTNGLDFEAILKLENLINNREEKQTVFIPSHDFNFLESVCNKFYLLYKGQVIFINNNEQTSIRNKVISLVEEHK